MSLPRNFLSGGRGRRGFRAYNPEEDTRRSRAIRTRRPDRRRGATSLPRASLKPNDRTDAMRIRELADRTGHTPETIRYYEKVGLLNPAVRELGNNYRQYGAEHVARLAFIRRCRSLDMALDEIRTLLTALAEDGKGCCADPAHAAHAPHAPHQAAEAAHALVAKHLAEVDRRIEDLLALKGDLEAVAHRCGGDHEGHPCGILEELRSPK